MAESRPGVAAGRAEAPRRRPRSSLRLTLGALLAVLPVVGLVALGHRHRWISEDAFIDFRVVEHLLAGHGPVFNVGERVEAYTNPLWVAMLAAWRALGGALPSGALWLGLGLAASGLVAAQAGAVRLGRRCRPGRIPESLWTVPLGAAVFAAVPAVWDFATSGLETGLAFAWLGTTFWALARLAGPEPGRGSADGPATRVGPCFLTAALVGLGPLIRPDLGILGAAFLAALCVTGAVAPRHGHRARQWIAVIVAAGLLPAAYQLFRMGYFAALTSNTALAKEAAAPYWSQGWRYAGDLLAPYRLWLPLGLAGGWLGAMLRSAWRARDWPGVALVAAPLVGALGHAAYVIRVGGDFMHGRLLLPSLFAVLLPVATVVVAWPPARGRRAVLAGWVAGAVWIWVAVSALWLRVPYAGSIGPDGIADERGYYVRLTGVANPVSVEDYAGTTLARTGLALRARAGPEPRTAIATAGPGASPSAGGRRVLVLPREDVPLAPTVDSTIRLAALTRNIGATGYLAGPGVHVLDQWGLSDPIAARLRLAGRGRPGHEKVLPEAWAIARLGDPRAPAAATPEVLTARAALACGDLDALRRAVGEPLTARRFVANLRLAPRLTRLRIPPDPFAARIEVCAPTA